MNNENLVGRTIGEYQLTGLLGVGGMGAVYRAYQPKLKREVAVKVLPSSFSRRQDYVERFRREVEISALLEHVHIVPVYDYGIEANITYVAMRLLSGGSLSQLMQSKAQQKQPLPSLKQVSNLLRQLASALDYAHSRGIIHRDVKTSNIMFDHNGNAYLVDFGIAKLLARETKELTGTGMGAGIGTPNYMPPEQWRGDEPTPAADQYALAITIYYTLTGVMPFSGSSSYNLMHMHLNETPRPVHHLRSDIPPAVNDILMRALAKDHRRRFPSVTAFSQAFDAAISRQPASANLTIATPGQQPRQSHSFLTPQRTVQHSKLPLTVVLLTAAIMLIFAFGITSIISQSQSAGNATTSPVVILSTSPPPTQQASNPAQLTRINPAIPTQLPPATPIIIVVTATPIPVKPTLTPVNTATPRPTRTMITPLVEITFPTPDRCPNGIVPRMVIGWVGRVTPGLSNRVRIAPSTDSNVGRQIGRIAENEEFLVLDGPQCVDDLTWWLVNYEGMVGWTAEGTRDDRFLDIVGPANNRYIDTFIQRTDAVYQPFERGHMIWLKNTDQIFVIVTSGTVQRQWRSYIDIWNESDPHSDPSIQAPQGRQQPVRGFGAIWRTNRDVRDQLGWATDIELPYNLRYQYHYGGYIDSSGHYQYEAGYYQMNTLPGEVFYLHDDGTWSR